MRSSLLPRNPVNSFPILHQLSLRRNAASQKFHHFELVLWNMYPIQIHAIWLGFFASVVVPFGGFLASAIKQAYVIKDFNSLILGHGGSRIDLTVNF